MKKFLSLVLALIMTMSLVTIGASAAEYKDFTDKDEITYAEAVAVLNRLGIITGYSEGDFRPEGELTRGAAAKIIASLLIGPEAANNLTPTTAPFKDVPLDHTFAGPIAYCSTLKIINGYSDGSFQPGGTLTGYAFSKMLLGALGYDGDIEGFVGSGWNMNVMRLGGDAGLFDSISFKGNEPVNREQAAQLALNTLKATLVEYTGALNVTAGDASVTSKPTRTYVISNQEFATHINNKKASQVGNANVTTHYTVEFGEQHFVDLRMTYDRNTLDDFGRPSNEWSYKKVTIGTFPIEPDYVYTEQMEHDVETVTDATKARALGLTGFEIKSDGNTPTAVFVNGEEQARGVLKDVGDIADYTDNGTVVEVYISDDDADWVRNVVVVKTQLMEVKRLGTDYVALDLYDDHSDANGAKVMGYNQPPIDENVENVEVDDAYYSMLSGLKVGDKVAVVPVTTDQGSTYSVAKAYVPETVTGALTRVDNYGTTTANRKAIGVTVGGTAYDIALWNKDLNDIDGDKVDVTTKDVVLTLDEFGNAMLAKNVGDTSDFMIVGDYYSTLVNNRIVTYVHGWDISGQELNLNLGTNGDQYKADGILPGDLVYYTNLNTTNSADWKLFADAGHGIFDVGDKTNSAYAIKASNVKVSLRDYVYSNGTAGATPYVDKSVKFIYVTFDDENNVDFIEVKNAVQNVSKEELARCRAGANHAFGTCAANPAQACVSLKTDAKVVNSDSAVKAVVIKNESNDAKATEMLYIRDYLGSATKDSDKGEIVYGYTVAMNGPDGLVSDKMTIYSTKKLPIGAWARYSKTEDSNFDEFYTLKQITSLKKGTSVVEANLQPSPAGIVDANNGLIRLTNYIGGSNWETLATPLTQINIATYKSGDLGIGDEADVVRVKDAVWVDLTGNGIDSAKDIEDLCKASAGAKQITMGAVKLSMVFDDNNTHDGFRNVSMVVVQSVKSAAGGSTSGQTAEYSWTTSLNERHQVVVNLEATKPDFATDDSSVTVPVTVFVNGVYEDEGTAILSGNGKIKTGGVRLANSYADSDDNITVAVGKDDAVWSKVNVRYLNDDETGDPEFNPGLGTGSVLSESSESITFGYATTDTTHLLTYTVTGATLDSGSSPMGAGSPGQTETISVTATGKDYVTIKVAGVNSLSETFSITPASDATTLVGFTGNAASGMALSNFNITGTDTAETLKLTFAEDTGITPNKEVKLTANISDINNTALRGYNVKVVIDGKEYKEDILAASAGTEVSLGFVPVTKNLRIAKAAVTVTPIEKIKVTGGSWSANALTITLNDAPANSGDAVALTGTYTWAVGSASPANSVTAAAEGVEVDQVNNTIKVIYKEDLAVGNTITVVASRVAQKDDATEYVPTIVITLAADGAVILP